MCFGQWLDWFADTRLGSKRMFSVHFLSQKKMQQHKNPETAETAPPALGQQNNSSELLGAG